VRRLIAAVLVGLALAACGSPPPTQSEYDIVAEALKAFDRSDWVPAARLLREAIVKQPTDLRLHYSLAVAATHLELRDEAIREFQWVLANAPGTPEADAARNWLTAAGVLTTPTAGAGDSAGSETAAGGTAARDSARGDSAVRGRVVWPDPDAPVKTNRLQLFLKGIKGTPTQDLYMVMRTDEDGRFEFKNVPTGTFKLTNRIAGEPQWRLRVTVAAGQDASIDLTPQNSLRARDDFPQDDK
jgi:hypothetical protein